MPTLHSPTAPTHRRPARWPRIVAALVAAGIGSLAGSLAVPASGAAAPLTPRAASEFRDSIGVQTHFPFTGYAYDAAPTSQLAEMLRTVGIRHLRDDLCFNTEAACQRVRARLAAMQDALGPSAPRVDLVAGYSRELAAVRDRGARDADIERALTAATSSPLAPMLAGLEAVNEPDLKDSGDWTTAALADNDTFRRLLAQPRFAGLRGVPHLSPAIGHAANTPALLASGWTRDRADVGNFHPYPAAWGGPEHALATACGSTNALACAQSLGGAPAAAPWATESGYSTSGTILSTNWVSEQAQAIYLPRLLLENFRAGVARTYLYELVDLKPTRGSAVDGYGLWRARAAGSQFVPGDAKPAALAIARLNATIGDLGAAPTATDRPIDIAVRAGGRDLSDDDVRRVLLRRADGTYVLALWQPKTVWDNAAFKQADRAVPELSVEVALGGGSWSAAASRPSQGSASTGRWTNTRMLEVPVGADVTLLELDPDGELDDTPAPAARPAATTDLGPVAAQPAVAVRTASAARTTSTQPKPSSTRARAKAKARAKKAKAKARARAKANAAKRSGRTTR